MKEWDAYDAEAEERRRVNLGFPMSAWDRSMIRRGPRRNYGGTWVMMDSEGLHFISHDPLGCFVGLLLA